jgi:hypothetical protein
MPDALKRIDELERADSQAAICKAPSPADSATAANRLKHARETLLFDLKARHEEAWLIERLAGPRPACRGSRILRYPCAVSVRRPRARDPAW